MEQKKLKWKDLYNENKQRRFCQVTGIKKLNVELESNSLRALKEKRFIVIAIIVLFSALIIWSFRSDIKVMAIVFGFLLIAGIAFFVFNYFRFICLEEGLYIRFGVQEGVFPYNKIKSVYLSRYNDHTLLIPGYKNYSIVIRYVDSLNKLREFSFPNYFLDKKETQEFLNNFNIIETEDQEFMNFERFKTLKRIGKIVLIVLFALFLIGLFVMSLNK